MTPQPPMLNDFVNIHTHNPAEGSVARTIVNLEPEQSPDACGWYSTGIHPWRAAEADRLWPLVENSAAHPHVVAIGECGLDALRGPQLEIQREVFIRHISLSETLHKPLIIHAVRTWPQLIALRKSTKASMEWIIHGFRGNATLAEELLRHGFSLSFGAKFNPDAFNATPADRRYRETDSPPLSE